VMLPEAAAVLNRSGNCKHGLGAWLRSKVELIREFPLQRSEG
jgi:hypothetical protein